MHMMHVSRPNDYLLTSIFVRLKDGFVRDGGESETVALTMVRSQTP